MYQTDAFVTSCNTTRYKALCYSVFSPIHNRFVIKVRSWYDKYVIAPSSLSYHGAITI